VTLLDLLAVAWIAFSCFQGARRGLVSNALSLIGFAIGAVIGSRLAPHLLAAGAASPWLPLATMGAALVMGLAAQALAGTAAGQIRHHVLRGPLETMDTAGGLLVGAIFGVALVWLAAVVAVQQPVLGLRSDVQRSEIMPALLKAVPASTVLSALAQFDPLPVIPSLADRSLPAPTPGAVPATIARRSVVKVEGEACGLVIQGSGWAIAPNLIVTNAHVVAGEKPGQTYVQEWNNRDGQMKGTVVAISSDDDIAVIRVPGLAMRPLAMARHDPAGGNVALIGYPENGGLTVSAGRAGQPVTVITPDVYGDNVHARTVVPLRGSLRHGDSGGAVVNSSGRVVGMMFAADTHGEGGFGVPIGAIQSLIADGVNRPVSTGGCVKG
jgi:S1-C subfamily serine protease